MTEMTTAADLVRDEACTPSCLVAAGLEAAKCTCRCEGQYHAALAKTQLPAPADRPRKASPVVPGQLTLFLAPA